MKTLLTNAKVWLGKSSFTDAIGFDSVSGKTILTGSADKKDFDEVIDLKGKLVLPAFTDGHIHFVEGSFENSQLDLREARTKIDFKNGIREYNKLNGGKWICGGFFSEANFKEKIILDKYFFDEILSDVPMIISRFDTHSAFANSKALEITGLKNSRK